MLHETTRRDKFRDPFQISNVASIDYQDPLHFKTLKKDALGPWAAGGHQGTRGC